MARVLKVPDRVAFAQQDADLPFRSPAEATGMTGFPAPTSRGVYELLYVAPESDGWRKQEPCRVCFDISLASEQLLGEHFSQPEHWSYVT